MTQPQLLTSPPWWKFGHVWLVIAGPAVVVVASFITLYFAISSADGMVDESQYKKGINVNQTNSIPTNLAPAVQGRNHAATGAPLPSKAP